MRSIDWKRSIGKMRENINNNNFNNKEGVDDDVEVLIDRIINRINQRRVIYIESINQSTLISSHLGGEEKRRREE